MLAAYKKLKKHEMNAAARAHDTERASEQLPYTQLRDMLRHYVRRDLADKVEPKKDSSARESPMQMMPQFNLMSKEIKTSQASIERLNVHSQPTEN